MKTAKKSHRDSYMDLIQKFPLRPIRTEAERDAADYIMQKLAVRGEDNLDSGESDYLDVLSDLITDYDGKHWPMPVDKRTPLQRLQYLLEQSGTTSVKLREILGCSPTLISLILNGKRELSKENIRTLSAHFKIEAGYLL
jgi:HTH-type transcriptional regulator / antitoxin HigA